MYIVEWLWVKHGEAQRCQGMQGMRGSRHSLAAAFQFLGSEWRLYDYITRHFISSLMPDVEYDEKDLRNAGSVGSFEFVKKTSVETSRRR